MVGQDKIPLNQHSFRSIIILWARSKGRSKVHDYTRHRPGLDYVFETDRSSNQSYMTGQGKGIKAGDRLLLYQDNQVRTYLVKTIDYYAEPPNMWMALLRNEQG
jgi:hypothetical protein